MRIKLKKRYQRKLILLAKEKGNLNWRKLSKELNLAENYLKNELKKEKRTLSEKSYKKLCKISKVNFDNYIKEKLDNNWGRSKGGLTFSNPKLLIKNPSEELAELVGIILGDGNIWSKTGYHYVKICGDSEKDKEYLLAYVKPLFEKLFRQKMHFHYHKKCKELFLSKGSRDIVLTLKYFGLKPGNKKKNNIEIPKWIFKSNKYLRACIRGLIDTDGSLCPITGRDYHYIWFSSNIENLRKSFDLAMKKLGFKTSKWNIRENRTPDVYIGGKEMIKKYTETINFKNKRHLSKLNAPVV